MLKKYINIFFSEKTFVHPPKKKYLILDRTYIRIFQEKFGKKNCYFLDIRLRKINFYILWILFISNRKFDFFNYVITFIEKVEPRYVITGNDNLIWFYKLKSVLPKPKYVSVQNGFRNRFFFSDQLKKKEKYQADYIFTFNYSVGNYFKSKIKTKIVPIGSLRNNVTKRKLIKRRSAILFVSGGYPKNKYFKFYGLKILQRDFFKNDKIVLLNLLKYCKINNLSLEIVLRNKNDQEEITYFKRLSKNHKIVFHTGINDEFKIYKVSDQVKATVSSISTFGLENLSRGNRGAIFNNNVKLTKGILDIFFNLRMTAKGVFWSDKVTFKEIKRVLDFVTKCGDRTWKNKTNKLIKKIMHYNSDNNKLKKFIK